MKPNISRSMATALFVATLTATALAQSPNPSPAPSASPQARPLTPLKVQVVISRYEGDKKVSSFPYMLAVTANHPEPVNLRMGSLVPVQSGQARLTTRVSAQTSIAVRLPWKMGASRCRSESKTHR
jgi:hypothetical protein